MYRIMMNKDKRESYSSLYQFLTEKNGEGNIVPVEFADAASLDTQVEKMLNSGYSKSDFIIVKFISYTVDAKDYQGIDDEENSEPAAEQEVEQ